MKQLSVREMMEVLRQQGQARLKAAMAALRGQPPVAPENAGFEQFVAGSKIISDAIEKFGSLGRSPLLDGLTRLGPEPPLSVRIAARFEARFEARKFSSEAGSRNYKLFIPSCYGGSALPLVVMLHGCTQSADDFAAGTRMNAIAEEQGFFVAYPEQSRSANMSRCWNWFKPADQQRDQGEPSIIAGIVQQIMAEFSVRSRKVYVAGLSAGGSTAAILGAAYPEMFAAIGVHSGLAVGAASDMGSAMAAMRHGGTPLAVSRSQALPTIVFHGDQDNTVNIVNAGQVIAQAKGSAQLQSNIIDGASAGGMAYTRNVQSAGGKPVLEEWILHKAGHAWSGGSAKGSFTQQDGPDASREMIRFFFWH